MTTKTLRSLKQYADDARAVREDWETGKREWVELARSEGASWADVGRAMGSSKQAAQQRYGG